MAKPDFVFLDAGGTLIHTPRLEEIIARACAQQGEWIEHGALGEAVRRALERMHPPRPTSLDLQAYRQWWWRFVHLALAEAGFRGDPERVAWRLWEEYRSGRWFRLFPDTIEALECFRSAGCRLGVLSNWDDTLETFLVQLGIREYFECVISSYRAGVEKPDPEIFAYALRLVGVEAARAWHVGDDLVFDYLGALAAGVRPVLVDYSGKLAEAASSVVCPIVRTLSEAARVILSEGT
ncbi:MAG: HAD-IA family hydrolase [Blastocatellia bacterium]|nr:HAD-IA family hydrolase [Blastocatellia bacterium]MCS7156384.1 HAD-IA family hydrolase [Blastocatellia bacterium]MCX7751265.1 HAD-IA family hydrolase [Blastocatellia bacterium]MDW8168977.1 HAD-IA family hydrolase [Acidobacteriota bacterium]MDW8256737.1 HAD-IA family hydrolase [Acidobacteriota bacterium]